MADAITDKLIVSRRDKIRDDFLRNYKLKNPDADISEGTEPWNKASAFADIEIVNHANAVTLGQSISASTARGAALDEKLEEAGTKRLPATGASGYVRITASGSGGTIQAGDEIRIAGKRYRCARTDFYADKSDVPIVGLDTGPTTDQPGGVIGKWTRPRPGIAQDAVVTSAGLTGGHDVETDPEAQDRLRRIKSNPPASGNDAHVQLAALECPGVPVEQCFTYPAIKGPGVKAVAFTLRAAAGGNRIPSELHRMLMKQHLIDRFGIEDGIMVCALVAVPKTPILRIRWAKLAKGWVDLTPINVLDVEDDGIARVTAAIGPLAFTIVLDASGVPPQAGKTIAFYDAVTGTFKRKRVLTSTPGGGNTYAIACDPANGASDVTFTPAVGAAVSPWSDSLDTIVPGLRSYFATLGPGEQEEEPFDPGFRQRRSPSSPEEWSSEVSTRMLEPIFAERSVSSPKLVGLWSGAFETVPYQTPVGAPTVSSNLVTLGDIAVYPL